MCYDHDIFFTCVTELLKMVVNQQGAAGGREIGSLSFAIPSLPDRVRVQSSLPVKACPPGPGSPERALAPADSPKKLPFRFIPRFPNCYRLP